MKVELTASDPRRGLGKLLDRPAMLRETLIAIQMAINRDKQGQKCERLKHGASIEACCSPSVPRTFCSSSPWINIKIGREIGRQGTHDRQKSAAVMNPGAMCH
jgi:hypothetical protein